MLPHDRTCSTDRAQRLEAQLARPRLPLALPQTLEHELEVRRLDPGVGRGLVEHGLDERVLGRERRGGELAVAGERAEDRRAPGLPVEQVETQQVREQLGNPAGEVVKLSQSIVPQREEDVDAEARPPQELRQRRAERSFDPVIKDVLLEVVEQQVQLATLLGRGCDRVDKPRGRSQLAALGLHRGDQAGRRILRPRVVYHHRRRRSRTLAVSRATPAPSSESSCRHRPRPVEHGEPAREDVRRHSRDLALSAAEEEQRASRLGVLATERGEAPCTGSAGFLLTTPPPSPAPAQARRHTGRGRHVDHLDVAAPPELALERLQPRMHRPRAIRQRLAASRAARHDHAQRPGRERV